MANTYLTRTPSSASNRKTWTWSAWVKRSSLSTGNQVLFESKDSSGFVEKLQFTSSDRLEYDHDISGTDYTIYSDFRCRDTSGWYHIVFAKDTTQATETNRLKIYVNGSQIAMTEEALGYPPQNYDGLINYNVAHYVGANSTSEYFDGSMSHVHFIDGTALTPSAFGETDSTTGEWKINTSPSVTYGTNGFFILKDGNSVTDQSGEGNNFTVGGGTLTKTEDNPSNVFATANAIDNYYQNFSFTNGNTAFTTNSSSNTSAPIKSTIGINSGKYYWEVKCVGVNTGSFTYGTVGITSRDITTNAQGNHLGSQNEDYTYYSFNGHILNNSGTSNTGTAYGNTYTTGDIISVALDLDNNKLYFSKNGTWQNSGDPTSGSTGTGAVSIALPTANNGKGNYFTGVGDYHFSPIYSFAMNFGNGYFGTTAVSSAGTNASGIGIFEYDVPTGYTALSTKGLNL